MRSITRRDFVNGALVGAGGSLLGCAAPGIRDGAANVGRESLDGDWYGYGGVGDYRGSHGNTPGVVDAAHRLRDGQYDFGAATEVPDVNLVIVGAGMAGLGAALRFVETRTGGQTCLILDNHPVFGGEAKENAFDVDGIRLVAPQGANGFFVPPAVDDAEAASGDARYFAKLGIPREFEFRDWPGGEKPLRFCRDNYGYLVRGLAQNTSVGHFFAGSDGDRWAVDIWEQQLLDTPYDEDRRRRLLDWYARGATQPALEPAQLRRQLDTLSYEEYLTGALGMDVAAARHADLFLASACGLGSDVVSAWAASQLPMPGLADAPPPGLRRTSFPGGNSGFARCFVRKLIPKAIEGDASFEQTINGSIRFDELDRASNPVRLRLSATAVRVQHEGPADSADTVSVTYAKDGQLYRCRCKAVVMAGGAWMNRHVVADMPAAHLEAARALRHAPFLVANVALRHWRFLYKLGITAAIWDGAGAEFGYTCNIRNPMQVGDYQPPLDPNEPTVLSFYTPFFYPGQPLDAQLARGRAELLATSYADYERRILAQMTRLFGAAGFDAGRDVAGIVLNRWGHAYSVPYVGFYGGAGGTVPRDILRRSYGRIAFGHSELDGLQHYGPAADEGRRAFEQLRAAL